MWRTCGARRALCLLPPRSRNETASGWQQVNFSNPVAITAGTTYVASYHTNGDYSADPNLFATALTSGPLTAPADAGVFRVWKLQPLSHQQCFKQLRGRCRFQHLTTPVANDDSGFIATENTALSISASALLANDTDPGGLPAIDRRREQCEQWHGQL